MCQDSNWVIDMGASYHAIPQKDLFAIYKLGYFGMIRKGNSGTSKIMRMEDVHVETNLDCKLVLQDIRHVLDLQINLMSIRKLMKKATTTTLIKVNESLPKALLFWLEEKNVAHSVEQRSNYVKMR